MGGHAHQPLPAAAAARRSAGIRSATKNAHRPTPDEVGRAAGLRIRQQMSHSTARSAVYRRRPTPLTRYRRAHLVETAHITRYPAARPVATQVASYEDQPQPAMPATAAHPEMDAYGDTATNYEPGTAMPATAAQRSTLTPQRLTQSPTARSLAAPPATGDALPEAAEEGANNSSINSAINSSDSAEEPASEPPPDIRSESEVASLTIPHGAMPAPLKGSLASLERQNDRLTAEGLERIENEDDLAARIANHLLVPVPASDALTVNPALPPNHRYCRPWTARFVADLAREHDAVFHRPLEVSSAVRTVEYQRRLMRINGNAAPAEGDVVSPHLTGATIDIAKEGLTRSEMSWMRQRLLQLEMAGKIDVEEEFQQSCFHITVYKTYAPARGTRRAVHAQPEETGPSAPEESADGSATQGL
jgi:hypothetical protein